jgi:hypothetical protein
MMKTNKIIFCLALTLLCGGEATKSYADSPCKMSGGYLDTGGIGGTGHTSPDEDNGIGGTGINRTPNQDTVTTNVHLVGTVYAFGSICVNGLRVTYDAKTPVISSRGAGNVQALRLGQVVEVEARRLPHSEKLSAQEISIEHALIGPVTHLDRHAMTLEVMGERLQLQDEKTVAAFPMGSRVQVSGLRNNQGNIVVTRIELAAENQKDKVYGELHHRTGQEYIVGKTVVIFNGKMKPQEEGRIKTVEGVWTAGKLSALSLEDEESAKRKPLTYVSLEGYVSHDSKQSGAAKICQETFLTNHLSQSALRTDKRVIVTGVIDQNGRLVAQSVTPVDVPVLQVETQKP